MSNVLIQDAETLHRALDMPGDEVSVKLSRSTAEWFASLIDADLKGQQVIVAKTANEVSPAEAAALLGMSRPQVRKFMDQGRLEFRMVGSHYRIPLESIEAFKAWERQCAADGMARFSQLQNELGLFE